MILDFLALFIALIKLIKHMQLFLSLNFYWYIFFIFYK